MVQRKSRGFSPEPLGFRREGFREGSRVVFTEGFRERVSKKRGGVLSVVDLEMSAAFDHISTPI